jgi:hypothetical protein
VPAGVRDGGVVVSGAAGRHVGGGAVVTVDGLGAGVGAVGSVGGGCRAAGMAAELSGGVGVGGVGVIPARSRRPDRCAICATSVAARTLRLRTAHPQAELSAARVRDAPVTVTARRSVVLLVVVALLGGLSPLEQPVDLMGVRVPPLAHPVLEAR